MKIFLLVVFLISIPLSLACAWIWARKKGREAKRNRRTEMQDLFFSDISTKWFVSPYFWLVFALVGFIAVAMYEGIVGYMKQG